MLTQGCPSWLASGHHKENHFAVKQLITTADPATAETALVKST